MAKPLAHCFSFRGRRSRPHRPGFDMMTRCRVCHTEGALPFQTVNTRPYWRCQSCEATFLDEAHLPDRATERAQYDLHQNDPTDPRYRTFLSKLAAPLLERLPPHQKGLDYGCGPGPALAHMLREAGHSVFFYDPFYFPDEAVLDDSYDFITCTEAAEHFHQPFTEFNRLSQMVRPGGWLGVMTMFQTDDEKFADWHYRRDPTHVVFYRANTFRYLAKTFGWRCEIPAKDVALLQKV